MKIPIMATNDTGNGTNIEIVRLMPIDIPAYNHTKNHITAQGKILKLDEDTRSKAINSNPIFRLTRFSMVPCGKP
jgi:hypothetical protein